MKLNIQQQNDFQILQQEICYSYHTVILLEKKVCVPGMEAPKKFASHKKASNPIEHQLQLLYDLLVLV